MLFLQCYFKQKVDVPHTGRWFPFPVGQCLEQVSGMAKIQPQSARGDAETHFLSSPLGSVTI